MNFRWYGSGFVVLLSILRSAYVARGWTAATSRARAGAGAGAGRGADERSTLRDIWLRETKVDSSNDALLREEDIEAAQIVPKRKGGSRSSRERADNKKRRALERKMATTSFRDERARMLQVRSSENGAGGETEGAFSSPSHSFNRELQHLTRTGKTRPLDGRTPAEQAEELLLDKVKGETAQDSPSSSSSYDTVSFNIVLQAWANQRTMAAALRADNLLSLMHHISSSSIPGNNQTRDSDSVRADAYSYAAVINGYAKSGGKVKAAIRATELLDEFERSSHVAVTSDVCYNAAMNAWAVSGSPQAGERAERILRQLLGMKNVRPTRIAYNACIKAHAKAGQPREAQRLLDQMKMLSTTAHQPQLSPDKITYSSCIDAWSHSCDSSEAAHQAEQLLSEMEEAFATTGDRNVQPDVVSYTSVLAAYAQTGSIHHRKAHELLERMQRYAQDEPNAPFLNAWIHLLAKTSASTRVWTATAESQESAAEEILAFMRSEYTERGCADMKPCKITYTAVITVLAQVGTSTAARRAEELLDELQAKWEETGDANYLPNAKTFASVLNAWAKSGSSSAVESAERLVRRMEDLYERTGSEELEPSLVVYLQVFQALANSRSDESADKAKRLLQKMHNLQLSGFPGVRPDATTYAYLINAFTKSKVDNVAELATVVLTEAEEGYRAGIGSLKPTPLLYSAVLQAYAKISSPEGSRLAEELLSRTKELYQQGKLYAKPTTLFCKCCLRTAITRLYTHTLTYVWKTQTTRSSTRTPGAAGAGPQPSGPRLSWTSSRREQAPGTRPFGPGPGRTTPRYWPGRTAAGMPTRPSERNCFCAG
jgi:pentatricopeptide repeat protein